MTHTKISTRSVQAIVLSFVLLLAGIANAGSNEDTAFVVIVNQANPTQSVSRADLSRFFLKKMTKWDNGTTVEPVDLLRDAPVRASFSKKVHKRSVSGIGSYWQNVIFSGRGVPPVELVTEQEAVAFVKSQPGAIAYVSKGTNVSGVTVIAVR